MSSSARFVSAVILLTLGLAVTVCAQSTTKQTSKAPKGSVSGRITIKDKGAPGVTVGLRRSDYFGPYQSYLRATTDQDGAYRISNVPAGSYFLTPAAPAFVIAEIGDGRGKSVVVGEDENVDGINFSLTRGGVITGKVTDAEGRPVIQQQVSVFRAEAFNQPAPAPATGTGGGPSIYAMGGAQTDDRGIYRIFGLKAGRYKVATGRGDDAFMWNFMSSRVNYKQVFHPDVIEPAKAIIIEVSEGSEANNVDIKLGPVMQTFSVSGRVIDGEKGLPVPNIRFGLQRLAGERAEFVNVNAVSNAAGEFIAEGLIPGKYSIFLFQNISTEMRADSLTFDVVDEDVNDVVIKLTKGASLSGVVVLESEDKALFQTVLQLQIRAFVMSQGPSGFGQSSNSDIGADGSFRLPGLPPGTANISIGSPMGPPPKGFTIARVERDGVVNPRGIEVKEGEQITGLRVVVSFGNGIIRGVVKLENGSLPPGMPLFVRLAKPGDAGMRLQPVQVDARGHFLIDGIPPGQYELSVTVPVQGPDRAPPRRVKQDVSVQNGIVTDVLFTIDLSAPQKP